MNNDKPMRDVLIYLGFIGVFIAMIGGFEIYRAHILKPPPSFDTSLNNTRDD